MDRPLLKNLVIQQVIQDFNRIKSKGHFLSKTFYQNRSLAFSKQKTHEMIVGMIVDRIDKSPRDYPPDKDTEKLRLHFEETTILKCTRHTNFKTRSFLGAHKPITKKNGS